MYKHVDIVNFTSNRNKPCFTTIDVKAINIISHIITEPTSSSFERDKQLSNLKCFIASLDSNLIQFYPPPRVAPRTSTARPCSSSSSGSARIDLQLGQPALHILPTHLGDYHLHHLIRATNNPSASSHTNCDTISTAKTSPRGA